MPNAAPPVRVYLDTCVYLDLLTENKQPHKDSGEPRWKAAKVVLDAVNNNRIVLGASALVEAEVNCAAAVRGGSRAVVDRVRGWFLAESTEWTDVDRFLARDAAALARSWHPFRANPDKRLGGADATHLAAAVRLRCDYLMTHDEAFPLGEKVEGVQVVRPGIVWPQDLLDDLEDFAD